MKDEAMVKLLLKLAEDKTDESPLMKQFFIDQAKSGEKPLPFFLTKISQIRGEKYAQEVISNICRKIRVSKKKPTIKKVLRIFEYELFSSAIVIDDNPYDNDKPDERFNSSVVSSLKKELKKNGREIRGTKNKEFEDQNERLRIWNDTETHIRNVFHSVQRVRLKYKKVFVIRSNDLTIGRDFPIETVSSLDEEEKILSKDKNTIGKDKKNEDLLESETLSPHPAFLEKKEKKGAKSLLVSDPITEAMRDSNRVLIMSGSILSPGGSSDQGVLANETPLFLSSTLSMALSRTIQLHPRSRDELIYVPDVFIFKNHLAKGLPAFAEGGRTISVLITPGSFKNEEECAAAIKCCLFFGKKELVFDAGFELTEEELEQHWAAIRDSTKKLTHYLTKSYLCVSKEQTSVCKKIMLK
jgi:hypothetical protein